MTISFVRYIIYKYDDETMTEILLSSVKFSIGF